MSTLTIVAVTCYQKLHNNRTHLIVRDIPDKGSKLVQGMEGALESGVPDLRLAATGEQILQGSKARKLILKSYGQTVDLGAKSKEHSLKEGGEESIVLDGEETLQGDLEGAGLVSKEKNLRGLVHFSEWIESLTGLGSLLGR